MTRILIRGAGAPPSEWELKSGTVTIGRKSDNDLCLDDPTVSGHHAKIVTYFQSSYVEDLDSTNGTLVNGRRVRMHTLHAGDTVTLGKFELTFDAAGQAPEPEAEPETNTVTVPQLPPSGNEVEEVPPLLEMPVVVEEEAQPAAPASAVSGAYFQVMVGERAGQRVPILEEGTELSPGVRVSRRGGQFIVCRAEPSSTGVVRLNSRELDPAGAPLRDMDMLQVNSVWMAFFNA